MMKLKSVLFAIERVIHFYGYLRQVRDNDFIADNRKSVASHTHNFVFVSDKTSVIEQDFINLSFVISRDYTKFGDMVRHKESNKPIGLPLILTDSGAKELERLSKLELIPAEPIHALVQFKNNTAGIFNLMDMDKSVVALVAITLSKRLSESKHMFLRDNLAKKASIADITLFEPEQMQEMKDKIVLLDLVQEQSERKYQAEIRELDKLKREAKKTYESSLKEYMKLFNV